MSEINNIAITDDNLLPMVSEVVAAYVSNHQVQQKDLPSLIQSVHNSLTLISNGQNGTKSLNPAVPINESYTDEYLICLEDGAKLKMLKRYLRTHYNMTPEEYRTKWGLPASYPMVAPSYAAKRSEFAKKSGLGKGNKK